VLLATLGLTYLHPANPDALDVPAALLWEFRLLAFALALVMWATIAATFGLLGERYRVRHTTR
jgi:hypothetical protein